MLSKGRWMVASSHLQLVSPKWRQMRQTVQSQCASFVLTSPTVLCYAWAGSSWGASARKNTEHKSLGAVLKAWASKTMETVTDFIFLGSKITADGDCSHEIKRHLLLGRKAMINLDSILKSRDITLPTKVHLVKAMVFPVVMYGCESWTIKKAERRRINAFELLEKTLESPLDSKEIQPVHPKENQSWIFSGRIDAEAPVLWPPDGKNWLIWKDPDAEKYWRQEEKGTTEDETVGWHHRLDGHEFEQAPGDGDEQGSLACCSPCGHKESDTTEWLNWTEHLKVVLDFSVNLRVRKYSSLLFNLLPLWKLLLSFVQLCGS